MQLLRLGSECSALSTNKKVGRMGNKRTHIGIRKLLFVFSHINHIHSTLSSSFAPYFILPPVVVTLPCSGSMPSCSRATDLTYEWAQDVFVDMLLLTSNKSSYQYEFMWRLVDVYSQLLHIFDLCANTLAGTRLHNISHAHTPYRRLNEPMLYQHMHTVSMYCNSPKPGLLL